ncbi:MAG: hypothetical protein AB1486_05225 [Planctomycetota bacterium]
MRYLLATLLMAALAAPVFAQCDKKSSCGGGSCGDQSCSSTCSAKATVVSTKADPKAAPTVDGGACCSAHKTVASKDGCYSVCPKQLTASLEQASAKFAAMPESDKGEMAKAMMSAGSECPIGKRMHPSMAFMTDAVELVYAFDNAAAEMAKDPNSMFASCPKEACDLFAQRRDVIATTRNVMLAHAKAMGECESACEKPGATTTSVSATGTCGQKCGMAKSATTVSTQSSPSCGSHKTAVATTTSGSSCCGEKGSVAKDPATRMNELFTCAQAMNAKADELLACWKECPVEVAALDGAAKAKLEQAAATMFRLNPAMEPSAKAFVFYAESLNRAVALNQKMMAAWSKAAESSSEGAAVKTSSGSTSECGSKTSTCTSKTGSTCSEPCGGETASGCPIDGLLQKTAQVAAAIQNALSSLHPRDEVSSSN